MFKRISLVACLCLLSVSSVKADVPLILSPEEKSALECGIIDKIGFKSYGGRVFCVYSLLGNDQTRNGTKIVYALAETNEFLKSGDNMMDKSGCISPIVLKLQGGKVVSAEVPGDGACYVGDIKRLLPARLHKQALSNGKEYSKLLEQMRQKVAQQLKMSPTKVKMSSDH